MAIVLKGRCVSGGSAEGELLISRQPIGFNFGINVDTGVITEHGHELCGKSIKDKILLFPHGKGSTGGSYVIYQLAKYHTGPRAMINLTTEAIIAVGAIMGKVPVIDSLDTDPYSLMADGDRVTVDASSGIVSIDK
jgi:predicted aconitase with swiveling domain